jgi:hypothetical protein
MLSFGNMKFNWSTHLHSHDVQRIINLAGEFRLDSIALADILSGLSGMKYEWNINGKLENAVYEGIIATSRSIHIRDTRDVMDIAMMTSKCVYYFGELAKSQRRNGEEEKCILKEEVLDSIWNGIVKGAEAFHAHGVGNLFDGYSYS